MSGKEKRSGVLTLIFRILVSSGIIAWLLVSLDWQKLAAALTECKPLYLVLAFFAIQITVFSSVWKWKLLAQAITNDRAHTSFKEFSKLYYIGLFFNNFLPSSVGGDVVRIIHLGKNLGMPVATVSVAMERLTSGVAIVGILICSAIFMSGAHPYLPSIYVLSAIFFILFLVLWLVMKQGYSYQPNEIANASFFVKIWMKIRNIAASLVETLTKYHHKGLKWWFVIIILSLAFQAGLAWINGLLFQAFHIEVSWAELFLIITLISALTMLPISINGLGVREVSYVFFFTEIGVPDEIAVFVSFLFFLLVSLSSLAGGVFWLMGKGRTYEVVREQVN